MIQVKDIFKIYDMGTVKVHALNGVSLSINQGEFTAIMGQSGSGKSTLMHILGCLDTPTSGQYLLDNTEISSYTDTELSAVRNKKIGFVFQSFNLLTQSNILHNVELPLIYSKSSRETRIKQSRKTLEALGLGNRLHHKPTELSGGQNQRVAIARALVTNPLLLLADEPTGNLDSKTGKEILALFHRLHDLGKTMIIVTHDREIAEYCKRIVEIKDGKIIADTPNPTPKRVDVKLEYDVEKMFQED